MSTKWHALSVDECANKLDTTIKTGLSENKAEERLSQYGENVLEQSDLRPWWKIIFAQFQDVMIIVLLCAALISGLIGEAVDTIIILCIIALNAILGAYQEVRAEKAIASLRAMATLETLTLRDGKWRTISSAKLVPGDIVSLEAGNVIPADARLIEGKDIECDESSLTGESLGVNKHTEALEDPDTLLADQNNMLFKGTQINRGSALAMVTEIGMSTELGRIAGLLKKAKRSQTPLQHRLAVFSKRLAISILVICLVVIILGLVRGEPLLLMLLTGISLAVAAIPEALPAVVSIALALGAAKMIKINALMRNLPSVETLGSVSYICSDKTGTLTQNKMHVDKLITSDSAPYALRDLKQCSDLAHALALNNDIRTSGLEKNGEPTELALYESAFNAGFSKEDIELTKPRIAECAFDSDRKRMTTVHQTPSHLISYTKGAPEAILSNCSSQQQEASETRNFDATQWLALAEDLAAQGYRVLAFAMKNLEENCSFSQESLESEMIFLGLAALIDPPREEAREAVLQCQTAGITPIMITGDHPSTALAIAKQINLVSQDCSNVVTGAQMPKLSDKELQDIVKTTQVYARVSPEQKVRLVNAIQNNGDYCAMTGDGVNDAPALKNAHIGVAMGKNGTDVAREASDMVLLDDNFATIVKAVEQGRRIFDNIRKFIRYTMTSNSGEIWVLLLAPFLGMPIPLLPIHILWINLVTDGLPGLALSVEPKEKGVMNRAPRPPNESIFSNGMWQQIILIGLLIGGLSLFAQYWALQYSPEYWQTMVFTTLTFSQLMNVMAIRSERESLFSIGFFSNKALISAVLGTIALQLAVIYSPIGNEWFKTQALPATELLICCGLALVVFFVVEGEKALIRKGLLYKAA
jgi:Ca2+-transporting ATPase